MGYHIIQSFKPSEATPDQVHEIGCEFARRFLADRFECTVSTHLDKGHLHNHIVVNSVSFMDGRMFRNDFTTYYKGIRAVSDELCRENRLSVVETDGHGKSYGEWKHEKEGSPTLRGMVKADVEVAMTAADSFAGFVAENGVCGEIRTQNCAYDRAPQGSAEEYPIGQSQHPLQRRFAAEVLPGTANTSA